MRRVLTSFIVNGQTQQLQFAKESLYWWQDLWTVWVILSSLHKAWHLLQQMYPQSSFPKTSTAKGLSVRSSPPPNWVAVFELNKSMPETSRSAENVQFNSCCRKEKFPQLTRWLIGQEQGPRMSWYLQWQQQNSCSRETMPDNTNTALKRQMVSSKLSLFIHYFTIRYLILKHCHDWDFSVLTLWGKSPQIPFSKVHRESLEFKGKGWEMVGV